MENFRDKYKVIMELAVEKEQYPRYYVYATKIQELLENGEVVPTAWLIKFFMYYRDINALEKQHNQERNKKQIAEYTHNALQHFADAKEYQFNGEYDHSTVNHFGFQSSAINVVKSKRRKRRTNLIPTSSISVYSLETLLVHCISAFILFKEKREKEGGEIRKNEVLHFFDSAITAYTDTRFTIADKSEFTDYKRRVLSGYLTNKVAGFLLSEKLKKNFTNAEIFQATRSAFKKKKA